MSRFVHAGMLAALAASAALAFACGGGNGTPSGPGPMPTPPPQGTGVLVGAGDIADCANDGGRHAEDTAKLLDGIVDATVFAAGDLAYLHGSAAEFANCYEPRWGRHKRRTRPTPGNHEYESQQAVPYFSYFGPLAGDFGVGYYSYNLAAWHIVVLNSNIPATSSSEQMAWLRDDLASTPSHCTLAYWHYPRFSSGPSSGTPTITAMADVWRTLYEFRVDVVINGHDHFYERFAPQDPEGRRDTALGLRQFIVGTGGAPLYPFLGPRANSEVQIAAYGVLKLTLRPNDYDWTFIEAVSGSATGAVRDTGSGSCH